MLSAYLPILLGLFALPRVEAAQCCSWRGEWDEPKLWEAREKLCKNPTGGEAVDGGYQVKVDVTAGYSFTEYVFRARADNNNFANCWDATGQIIAQCARNKYGVGTWQWNGENYAMSASSISYRKRDGLPPLPDFTVSSLTPTGSSGTMFKAPPSNPTSELKDGVYEVDGNPVEVHFEGLNFAAHQSRDLSGSNMLLTNSGPIANWTVEQRNTVNLKDAITEAVRATRPGKRSLPKRRLAKRGQTCETVRYNYVMVEIGAWTGDVEPASDSIGPCGGTIDCSIAIGKSITFSESFSIGLSSGLKNDIADTALSLSYSWTRSYTTSSTHNCGWSEGQCHIWYVSADYVWQRGFVIEAVALGEVFTSATVKVVHGDAPSGHHHNHCDLGCCHPRAPNPHPGWCNMMQPGAGREAYYGTCRNWDFRPPWCTGY